MLVTFCMLREQIIASKLLPANRGSEYVSFLRNSAEFRSAGLVFPDDQFLMPLL